MTKKNMYVKDFPFLAINSDLVYVDNAATTQKPAQVIQALEQFYTQKNCSIHRGIYPLAEDVTEEYESVRKKTAQFIGAESSDEIIFTANATASCNMVAYSLLEHVLKSGDEIIVTAGDHFSNLLPWLALAREKQAKVHIVPVVQMQLDYDALEKLVSERTRFIAIPSHTNVTGEAIDCARIIKKARQYDSAVLVDASQTMVHERISVSKLDCDFLAFSAHKALGPMGVGVLFAKRKFHSKMKPFMYGGGMLSQLGCNSTGCSPHGNHDHVHAGNTLPLLGCKNCPCFIGNLHGSCSKGSCTSCLCSAVYKSVPYGFEAGTPNVGGILGWGAALDYLNHVDFDWVQKHEQKLCSALVDAFSQEPFSEKIRLFIPKTGARHIVTFVVNGMHAHDVASALGSLGVCVRAGTHCAQLAHDALGIQNSVRISFALYNTLDDVERVIQALKSVISL